MTVFTSISAFQEKKRPACGTFHYIRSSSCRYVRTCVCGICLPSEIRRDGREGAEPSSSSNTPLSDISLGNPYTVLRAWTPSGSRIRGRRWRDEGGSAPMIILNFAPDQTWPVTEPGAGCAGVQEKQSQPPAAAAVIGHRRPSVDLHFSWGAFLRPGVRSGLDPQIHNN